MDISQLLTASVTPVVLISACGLITLALYNRLGAILARLRAFHQQKLELLRQLGDRESDDCQTSLSMVDSQIEKVTLKAKVVQKGLYCLLSAVVAFLLCSTFAAVAVLNDQFSMIALGMHFVGLLLFLSGIGWPIAQPDDVRRACLAALDIRAAFEQFARIPDHPLAGFKVGIGIATGRAVAGQIGSRDQVKVTAFGPGVNLAARLEGLTKVMRVPVLLDEATARIAAESLSVADARCRRLARIRPYGLEQPLIVSELLPRAADDPAHSAEDVATYESALTAFLAGRWGEAYELLHRVPAQDLGKDFLVSYILQHNHTPPPDWDGVIRIDMKP